MSTWISVKDKLPELGIPVDIWVLGSRHTNVWLDHYSPTDHSLFWYNGDHNLFEVASIKCTDEQYWMPISEGP